MRSGSLNYIIELDGSLYRLYRDQLEPIEDHKDVDGEKWLITDMQDAISRTMTVNASVRYVDVMVRKRIQESGEFEENVAVISHWKQKKDVNTTDICFTALPARMYGHYRELGKDSDESMLVFSLYSVLLNTLRQLRSQRPVAVVFQHDRFADLVVGTKNRVLYANRCVAFDTTPEQISALWNTIKSDIQTVEQENRIRVEKQYVLTWIDSGELPDNDTSFDYEICRFEEDTLHMEHQIKRLSFTRAIKQMSGAKSISQPVDKICYYARQAIPYLNMAFLALAILLAGVYFYYQQQSSKAEQLAAKLTTAVEQFNFQIPEDIDQQQLDSTLGFLQEISAYSRTPSYKRLINDVSQSITGEITVDVFKVNYASDKVEAELFGRVNSPFKNAHKKYQELLNGLKLRGYSVVHSRFDTEINTSQFLLKIARTIQ